MKAKASLLLFRGSSPLLQNSGPTSVSVFSPVSAGVLRLKG